MPDGADVGFEGYYHALFEDAVAGRDHVGFLLVPPRTDAVAGQGHVALEAGLVEAIVGEVVDVRRAGAGDAAVDGGAVDVQDDLIRPLLLV